MESKEIMNLDLLSLRILFGSVEITFSKSTHMMDASVKLARAYPSHVLA